MSFDLLCFLIGFAIKVSSATIRNDSFHLMFPQTRLTSGIAWSENGLTLRRCALSCAMNRSRVAFNYDVVNQMCEIIEKQENLSNNSLITNKNFSYYLMRSLSPCKNKPCLYGSVCVVTSEGMDYRCLNCPYPTGGKNCDELRCGTTCFRINDRVYFTYPNQSLTSVEAYLKCASVGMSMAMIKDNATQQFIQNQFKAIYSSQTSKPDAYWLGLNRTSSSSPWKWTDGSDLGPFAAWSNTGKDLCVCMPNGASWGFAWDPDPCNRVQGWSYFAFCQQTYSFFKTQ